MIHIPGEQLRDWMLKSWSGRGIGMSHTGVQILQGELTVGVRAWQHEWCHLHLIFHNFTISNVKGKNDLEYLWLRKKPPTPTQNPQSYLFNFLVIRFYCTGISTGSSRTVHLNIPCWKTVSCCDHKMFLLPVPQPNHALLLTLAECL